MAVVIDAEPENNPTRQPVAELEGNFDIANFSAEQICDAARDASRDAARDEILARSLIKSESGIVVCSDVL